MHLTQVGVATLGEGAHKIQRASRRVVRLQQALRVGAPGVRIEGERVHRVAEVTGQLDAVASFHRLAAGLEVLASQPAHLDHGKGCRVGEHDRHLQHCLEPGSNRIRGVGLECFRAVTAGKNKSLAPRRLSQTLGEQVAFTGEHQGRQGLQLRHGTLDLRGVGPRGLLDGGKVRPGHGVHDQRVGRAQPKKAIASSYRSAGTVFNVPVAA